MIMRILKKSEAKLRMSGGCACNVCRVVDAAVSRSLGNHEMSRCESSMKMFLDMIDEGMVSGHECLKNDDVLLRLREMWDTVEKRLSAANNNVDWFESHDDAENH